MSDQERGTPLAARAKSPASHRLFVCIVLCAAFLGLCAYDVTAQTATLDESDEPEGFLGLSLEDLMSTDVQQISVLGTHTHLAGEWMIGYKFMPMMMSGIRQGTTRRSIADVLQQYMVAPTSMRMEMHMLEVMRALNDQVTFMAMVPYIELSMDHRTRMNTIFTTQSAGLGDLRLEALFTAVGNVRRDSTRLILRAGMTVPTGSIDETGNTPMGNDQQLPYPMQLGSGTYDLHPGVTLLSESRLWAWTAEADGAVRLGLNDHDYRLGNQWNVSASSARRLTRAVGAVLRVEAGGWGNIHGADPDLNPMMVPTADPRLRGGSQVVISPGIEFYFSDGMLGGNRFGLEVGFPIHQSFQGPQLESDWTVRSGWSVTF